MEWFIFALLGAFFSATSAMVVKKGLKKTEPLVLLTWISIITGVFLMVASLVKGIPSIGEGFYLSLAILVVLNILANVLYYKSLKVTDLSLAMPMLSFTPIFLILTSFLILGEFPSTVGIVGIVVIVIGSYILNSKKGDSKILDPIKYIFKHKGTFYMLVVAFIFSLTGNYVKIVTENSDYLFGVALVLLVSGFVLLIFSFFNPKSRITNIKKGAFWDVVFASVASGLALALVNIALGMQIVPYVISIKRMSIVFAVIYGDILFREKNFSRRIIGALIMLVGVLMIVLF